MKTLSSQSFISRRTLTIPNRKGLHARASAKFVQTAHRFNAEVIVTYGEESVSGSSIMELLTLGATYNTPICISTIGPDAEPCLDALAHLVEHGFFEELFLR
jgi:phosphocarrier protein